MELQFGYLDEDDRSYGAAGMAIGLMVYKGAERLSSIDIDEEPWRIVDFFGDYLWANGGTRSARGVWGDMLGRFELEMAMAISNVMCRRMVREHERVTEGARAALLSAVIEDGVDVCALEDDEVEGLFNKEFDYLYRVFSHRGIGELAHDLAGQLRRLRRLSRMDVLEALRDLR